MANAIRVHDQQSLSPSDRNQAIKALVNEAVAPISGGQAYAIKARIHQFEARYEFPSEQLSARLREGRIAETADVAEWLFVLRLKTMSGG